MDAALGHGDDGPTDDEDNGEEMSDLSSVCSCDSPPHGRLNAATAAETPRQCLSAAEATATADARLGVAPEHAPPACSCNVPIGMQCALVRLSMPNHTLCL